MPKVNPSELFSLFASRPGEEDPAKSNLVMLIDKLRGEEIESDEAGQPISPTMNLLHLKVKARAAWPEVVAPWAAHAQQSLPPLCAG